MPVHLQMSLSRPTVGIKMNGPNGMFCDTCRYILVCFPQHNVEGLLFSWPSPCLGFPFLGPLGKIRLFLFAGTLFKAPMAGYFFDFFTKIINKLFSSNCFAPWQETFADAWDGDGGGPYC